MCNVLTLALADRKDLAHLIKAGYLDCPLLRDIKWVAKNRLSYRAGYWWRGTQIYVPNNTDLRTVLISDFHSAPYSGHRGRDRTLQAIAQHYWWPGMPLDVQTHVGACALCQKNKPENQKPGGTNQPLPIPEDVWDSISMDLITQLPTTKDGHDAIVVFVDRLSKMTHFVPTTTDVGAVELAKIFIATIFRPHGLPTSIVSDRDPRFTSKFWQEVMRLLGTDLKMSTAFHPQTDGQTERMNRVLEETLRHYIAPDQTDWDEHLSLIEFAINNSRQRSTGLTPFALNGLKQPRVPTTPAGVSNVPSATQYVTLMQARLQRAKERIAEAQKRQSDDADVHRRPVAYQVGQEVLLSTRNLKLKTSGKRKLAPLWVGPYKITQLVGPVAVKLALPKGSRIHPVFHVQLIKPHNPNATHQPPQHSHAQAHTPDTDMLQGDPYYAVEAIVGHRDVRVRGGSGKTRREYLIKWEGMGHHHNSFEPEKNLMESAPLEDEMRRYEDALPPDQRKHTEPEVSAELCCEVCHKPTPEDTMLLCSKCETGWHMECLTPPVSQVPKGRWYCPTCYKPKPQKRTTTAPQQPVRRSARLNI